MAARNCPLAPNAVFHSDRGSNYRSSQFAATLKRLNIRQPVGRTGICYDNVMAESFNAAIKTSTFIGRSTRLANTPAETRSATSNSDPI